MLDFFGYPVGTATELLGGTVKLRYSSSPFLAGNFPTGRISVVGSGPGPSVHFPEQDPVMERPAKRARITGKSSAVRRARVSFGDLPTPKRWKELLRIEDDLPPFLFPRTGVG